MALIDLHEARCRAHRRDYADAAPVGCDHNFIRMNRMFVRVMRIVPSSRGVRADSNDWRTRCAGSRFDNPDPAR